jgi:hypothetical protein
MLFENLADDPAPLPKDEARLLAKLPTYGNNKCVQEIPKSDETICRRLERRGLIKIHRWKNDPLAMLPTLYAGRLL